MKNHQQNECTTSINTHDEDYNYARGHDSEQMGDFAQESTPLLHSIKSTVSGVGQNSIEEYTDGRLSTKNTSYLSSLTSIRHLEKSVGLLQGFTLIVGILVGSGVFISPALLMADVQDAGISLVFWLGCGLIALGGCLCYCELGCAIKQAGGNYAYIREAYGSLPAFLCSWTISFLVDPTAVAAITLTLGTYVMKLFEDMIEPNPWYAKAIAAVVIVMIAFLNCWSVKAATRAQVVFTFAQVSAVMFVAVIGIWMLSKGHTENIKFGMFNNTEVFSWAHLGTFGSALYNGLWAYDGWALVSNVTEEMINLDRNLFLSIVIAIPFVIGCYILVNISFLSTLTVQQISQSPAVALTFVQKSLGQKAAFIMPILVAISCYGGANGTVFACGRLSLAAGREGHLPEVLSMIHKERLTPIPAVLLTAFIAITMLIPNASQLETLISFFNFCCWFIYGLSLFAVIVLRIRQPNLHRPYRVWLITPILMTLISIFLVVMPFLTDPMIPLTASLMIALGVPFYIVFVYFEPKHPRCVIKLRKRFQNFVKKLFNLSPCRVE